jgi:hypothetical protein
MSFIQTIFGIVLAMLTANLGGRETSMTGRTELEGVLSFDSQTGNFLLRFENKTRENVAVLRWNWTYEIRLYDKSGSRLKNVVGQVNQAAVTDGDWVVLRPGDSCGFHLAAYAGSALLGTSGVWRAECDIRKDTLSRQKVPAFVRQMRATPLAVRTASAVIRG